MSNAKSQIISLFEKFVNKAKRMDQFFLNKERLVSIDAADTPSDNTPYISIGHTEGFFSINPFIKLRYIKMKLSKTEYDHLQKIYNDKKDSISKKINSEKIDNSVKHLQDLSEAF